MHFFKNAIRKMRDAKLVTTEAAKGLTDKLAEFWEVSTSWVSEFFGKDNPYPKFRRMVRAIAGVTKGRERRRRLMIIKVDFNAFIDELIGDASGKGEVEACVLCDELYDVMRTKMAKMSPAERLKELREADAIIQQEINALTKEVEQNQ